MILDANKSIETVLNDVHDDTNNLLRVNSIGGLVGDIVYDYIAITYVAAGSGVGKVETVTYKDGGASGTTKATLTLAYNASNKLTTVTRS